MQTFRKIATSLFAGWLLATWTAALLHDHSHAASHDAKPTSEASRDEAHHCHAHHTHHGCHRPATAEIPAGSTNDEPHPHPHRHAPDDHDCLLCQFLAAKPLAATAPQVVLHAGVTGESAVVPRPVVAASLPDVRRSRAPPL